MVFCKAGKLVEWKFINLLGGVSMVRKVQNGVLPSNSVLIKLLKNFLTHVVRGVPDCQL